MRPLTTFLTLTAITALSPGCGQRAEPTSTRTSSAPSPTAVTQYSVGDFYKNVGLFGASWSSDRQWILVSSNLSGIWNAYAVPATGGDPIPLTKSAINSVFAISYFPADDRILFTSDDGGNELTHLFVGNPDGTTRDLTP